MTLLAYINLKPHITKRTTAVREIGKAAIWHNNKSIFIIHMDDMDFHGTPLVAQWLKEADITLLQTVVLDKPPPSAFDPIILARTVEARIPFLLT